MKKRLFFILCAIFCVSVYSFAQTRTVTNSDLEKFRQKRLQAEADYRENYKRLGFPSPEELARQREQDSKELSELSERLTNERLEREAMQREDDFRRAQLEVMRSNSEAYSNQSVNYGNGYYPSVYYGAYPYYGYSTYGYQNYGFQFYYGNRFWRRHGYYNNGFWRGGNFYDTIAPGTVFPPSGVRINTNSVRIGASSGGIRFPAQIRSPR